MRFLTILILGLALIGCEDAQEAQNDSSVTDEASEDSKMNEITEAITRIYSVKFVNDEPSIDTLQRIWSITTDSKGKELEKTHYNLDLTTLYTDKYKYDESGNKVGADHFDKGTDNTFNYEYETDSEGRITTYRAISTSQSKHLITSGAYIYENDGKLKKDGHINQDGKFEWNFEYLFDTDGKELGYVYVDNFSNTRYPANYEYVEFNDENQWLKRYVVKEDVVQSIETREFEKK